MKKLSILSALIFLLLPASLFAADPVALAALGSGDLLIIDAMRGIVRVSGNTQSAIIPNFGVFQPSDLAAARLADRDGFFVTLRLAGSSRGSFTQLTRWSPTGQRMGQWTLPITGAALSGVVIDPRNQIAYCADSRLNAVYKLDLNGREPRFVTLVRIRDAGTLGPMLLDAERGRLLVADVTKGKVLAVSLSNSAISVLIDEGTIREPVALALDPATDRLFIADATRGRVWSGSLAGGRFTPRSFSTHRFREPVGLAWSSGTLWVADRETKRLSQFNADGLALNHVALR